MGREDADRGEDADHGKVSRGWWVVGGALKQLIGPVMGMSYYSTNYSE